MICVFQKACQNNYALINPYIHFNGNAGEAFIFYKSIFGGEFAKISRYQDNATGIYSNLLSNG